jgi:hypothetical protein
VKLAAFAKWRGLGLFYDHLLVQQDLLVLFLAFGVRES